MNIPTASGQSDTIGPPTVQFGDIGRSVLPPNSSRDVSERLRYPWISLGSIPRPTKSGSKVKCMETTDGEARPEDSAPAPLPSPAPARKSKSADEARARTLARTRAMTARERMIRALALAEETEENLVLLGRARP